MAIIVWFRRDLRIEDHAPLYEATRLSQEVIPLVILPKEQRGSSSIAGNWWYLQSLKQLKKRLSQVGLQLIIRFGSPKAVFKELAQEVDVENIFYHKSYEPYDQEVERALGGVAYQGRLLVDPEEVKPYKVFTPFWKHLLTRGLDRPLVPLPSKARTPKIFSEELPLFEHSYTKFWTPGETSAKKRLHEFSKESVNRYDVLRDRPDRDGTSRLSPALCFGELSPAQIWMYLRAKHSSGHPFLRQLIWREFAYHLLWYHPETVEEPLRKNYLKFPWKKNEKGLQAWKEGRVGYPIVDAGMRQLLQTGWMHNRVRMIVASFLVKDLLLPWQLGAEFFLEKLVDADLANNTLGWQWTAGCGADAAPFFRIFNPVLQGEKFDPEGTYVKQWVPELAEVSPKVIHKPWVQGGVTGYPDPIVDHKAAREEALKAYQEVSS